MNWGLLLPLLQPPPQLLFLLLHPQQNPFLLHLVLLLLPEISWKMWII